MAEADLVAPGLTQRQYLARYKAWGRRFAALRKAAAAAAASRGNNNNNNNEEEEAAEAADAGEAAEVARDTWDDDDSQLEIVGPDAEDVQEALLDAGAELLDPESGRARLPAPLGWPGATFSATRLESGIPETSVVLVVDLSAVAQELPAVLRDGRPEFLAGRFGELPPRARVRVQQKMLERDVEIGEDVLLGPDPGAISEGKRRKTFVPAHDPLQGYIYDMCDHALYERFILDVRLRDRDDRLRVFRNYLHNMRQHLRGHLLSGKAHSRVLKTTQLYVDAVDATLPVQVWASVGSRWAEARRGRVMSDFEVARETYFRMFSDFNAVYWALTGRNLNIVHNFLYSEFAWRTGTCGNFKGIGYTVTVMDAAGLTWTKTRFGPVLQPVQNFKKEGTTGYDLDRKVYQEIRRMYTHVIPRTLSDRHVDDGHIDCSTMRATPGSIGEGMIWIVEGRIEKAPTDSLGTARFFPEGLGENKDTQESCVRLIPRDDSVRIRLQTSTDTAQTGVRQEAERRSVDGFAFTLCSFARNQQPDSQMVMRRADLDRVITNLPSSGPYDDPLPVAAGERDPATLMPWEDAAVERHAHVALMASSRHMDEATKREHGGFFAFPMLNGSLAALMQKLGMLPWNISPPVDWLIRSLYNKFHASVAVLMSPLRLKHCSRVLDTSILMAGVAPTALVRSFQTLAVAGKRGGPASDAVVHLSQLQFADALHVSMVPAVLMRFLASLLDFPVLAVLACLFRELEMPVLSMRSVCEFLNAQPISDAADAQRVRDYLQAQLAHGSMCASSELLGEPHEARNISLFVTGRSARHGASALKCSFVIAENERRDIAQLKRERLVRNVCDVLTTQLVEYSQFCKEFPDASIQHALTVLMQNDFNLALLVGSHRSFYDHKRIAKNVLGSNRFDGVAPMAGADFALLRIMPVGGNAIGFGVNLAPALLLSALMVSHRRDWDLQVAVAQSIVRFTVETQVPYALLPVDSAPIDNFRKDGSAATVAFRRAFRPLQYTRSSHAKVFSTIPGVVPEGSTAFGLFEDTAHMQTVLSLADALGYEDYRYMNLCAWEFEIAFGLPGDAMPLCPCVANARFTQMQEELEANPERIGWVEVEPDGSLRLCVIHADGSRHSRRALDLRDDWDRREQQRFVLGHGWGPVPCFRRCGVLLGGMQTLVPVTDPAAPADFATTGFSELRFFRDGYYRVHTGERVTSEDVLARVLCYGTPLVVDETAPALQALRARLPDACAADARDARLLVQSSLAPCVGMLSVGVRCANGDVAVLSLTPEQVSERPVSDS